MFLGLGLTIHGQGGGGGAPAFVLRSGGVPATWDTDFSGNQAFRNGDLQTVAAQLTVTQASSAYYENFDGTLTLFGPNTARYGDKGLLHEPARTNVVLHNRDLANGVWTKIDCITARDQTGPDGVANSASQITATAANATFLQAITLASSARRQTAYIRRLTGTGVINMTMDNGTTWTAVTVTSAWKRVTIPTQTLANPTVGFRIVTSGDAVAIDFVQNENDSLSSSSPIATTTVAVTRAADSILVTNLSEFRNQAEGTFFCDFFSPEAMTGTMWVLSDGTTNNDIVNRISSGTSQYFTRVAAVSQGILNGPNMEAGIAYRNAAAYKLNDNAFSANDTAAVVDNTVTIPTMTQLAIGTEPGGTTPANGYIRRMAYWPTRLSDAELLILSRSNVSFIFLVDGDSIPTRPVLATCFPTAASAALRNLWFRQNSAVSQSRVVYIPNPALDLTVRGPTFDAVLTKYVAANATADKATVIHVGTNDAFDGTANATILAELEAYGDARRAAGHYLGLCTILPDTRAGVNTARAIINPSIRAMVGVHCDFIIDWDLTIMGSTDAIASDTIYYVDGTHPTAFGAAILGDYLQTLLNAL